MSASVRHFARIGAGAAIAGSITRFVGTLLHPMSADPNDPIAAFSEYAAARLWIASHLAQFLGVAWIGVGLLALGRTLSDGARAEAWATIGAAGIVASVAAAAVLQAVDGVALKAMVDAWASSPAERKEAVFWAAYGVRQIEVGVASLASLLLGLTIGSYGIALLSSASYPWWLGAVGLLVACGEVAAGVALAYGGFSALAMSLSMPASAAGLVWVVGIGVALWRNAVET